MLVKEINLKVLLGVRFSDQLQNEIERVFGSAKEIAEKSGRAESDRISNAEYLIPPFAEQNFIELVLPRERKTNLRHTDVGDPIQLPPPSSNSVRVPRIAFGIVPLTTPYGDSDPDHRILNAVARGLLFERMKEPASELAMTKIEYSRALRSLRNDGLIYAGVDGKYHLTFGTANFPNIVAHEDGI